MVASSPEGASAKPVQQQDEATKPMPPGASTKPAQQRDEAVKPMPPGASTEPAQQRDEVMKPMPPGYSEDQTEKESPATRELDEAVERAQMQQVARRFTVASCFFLWLTLTPLVAWVYKAYKASPPIDLEKARQDFAGQDFMYGPFSCYEDRDVMLWSLLCPSARWADTMGTTRLLSFWAGFGVFMVACLANILLTRPMMWIFSALILTFYRQQLRKDLGLRNEGDDQVKDFAMWAFCCCFAVAQEARQVKLCQSKVEV